MNHYRRTLCLFIGCVLVMSQACVTPPTTRNYQLRPGSGKGLVVVSLSQPYDEMTWMYRNIAEAKPSRDYNDNFITTANLLGHPLVRYGDTTLHPFELQAGEYEFFRWAGPEVGSPRAPVAFYDVPVGDFSIKFRCIADQVTYIGNLQLEFTSDGKFALRVRDMQERDIAELIKAYKNIRPDTIRAELMQRPVWAGSAIR
ncbi:MAG TPA: hypothetical protein VI670_10340 [Thermoanaerobaculia bacterium]|jgi:hypothetical protein